MSNRINLQLLLSYLGLLPFLFIILDKFFFNLFTPYLLVDFSILYSIIIFVFIGALHWNLGEKISLKKVLIGFSPSLFSVFIILLYLLSYNIFLIIIICFLCQLILDKFLYKKQVEKILPNSSGCLAIACKALPPIIPIPIPAPTADKPAPIAAPKRALLM